MALAERNLEGRGYTARNGLKKTNKYRVGEVQRSGHSYFLKELRFPGTTAVRDDLRNEVRWFVNVAEVLDGSSAKAPFTIPQVIDVSANMDWALYEHLYAQPVTESALEANLPSVSDTLVYLFSAPFPRQDTSLSNLFSKKRFGKMTKALASEHFSEGIRQAVTGVLQDESLISIPKPGLVHGDFNPKNILIPTNGAAQKILVDPELGTTPDKPEWDKPRYEDIAFFYHLLNCQYQNPRLAWMFLADILPKLKRSANFDPETFSTEFSLSLLERTLSMMDNFVVSPKPGAVIDDIRRTNPAPYVTLVTEGLFILNGREPILKSVNFSDEVHKRGLGQTQYASRFLSGIAGKPALGKDLRHTEIGASNYHEIRIHPDDMNVLEARIRKHLRTSS